MIDKLFIQEEKVRYFLLNTCCDTEQHEKEVKEAIDFIDELGIGACDYQTIRRVLQDDRQRRI